VTVAGDEREIVRRAGTDARPIVAVAGCADRTAAEALRGAELLVRRTAAPELGEDEFYAEDLEGCRVHDAAVEVGIVRRLLALPSCEVLEVARADGGSDLLVPMIRDAIREVDVAQRRIEVDMAFLGER
jgi:16S rRNA processing protein RimM